MYRKPKYFIEGWKVLLAWKKAAVIVGIPVLAFGATINGGNGAAILIDTYQHHKFNQASDLILLGRGMAALTNLAIIEIVRRKIRSNGREIFWDKPEDERTAYFNSQNTKKPREPIYLLRFLAPKS